MEKVILISIGAAFGALSRYFINEWAVQRWGSGFPFGTFIINVCGSLLIGLLLTVFFNKSLPDHGWRLFFVVGFLGSFTTFSSLMYESVYFIHRGQALHGFINIAASVLSGVLAAGLGIYLGSIIKFS